ncbi:MAG TPA: serine hydrolase [Gemmatimonadaceae bacterium]|jgi:beta-lactamase class A|nr:serine hydrolase [Gemmatimonadaceae bacterium]
MTLRRTIVRRCFGAACGVGAMLSAASGTSGAQAAQRAILAAKLRTELRQIADDTKGVVGAQVIDLATGERIGVNDTLTFPQGSAIKVPLLIELYHQDDAGTLKLSTRVPVRLADRTGGSGLLQNLGDGTSELSLGDLAMFMITVSDNTATNMLIDRVGMDKVNATTRALGVPEVKLQRKMIRPRDSFAGNENIATPTAAATIMAKIAKCELPMSRERCAALRQLLEIPKGGPIEASVPEGVKVAWKPGDIEGVNTAWGLVDLPGRPYVVVGMVNYSDADEGTKALRRIADAAYGYFHVLARSTPYGARVPLEVIPR